MKIVWYGKAERDLERAVDFIHDRNPKAALAVDLRLRGAVGHLGRFPEAGRPGRTAGAREVVIPEYPYIIRYRVKGEQVQVLRIFHTSRRWPE